MINLIKNMEEKNYGPCNIRCSCINGCRGAAEDLESDIGSQSNPNSQVQLAPQMGHLHRMINKATSGEPVAYGVWCGVAGAIAFIVMSLGIMPVVAIAMGACVAAFVHAIYTVTSHMGRIVGQSQFEQPLFMDV